MIFTLQGVDTTVMIKHRSAKNGHGLHISQQPNVYRNRRDTSLKIYIIRKNTED